MVDMNLLKHSKRMMVLSAESEKGVGGRYQGGAAEAVILNGMKIQ